MTMEVTSAFWVTQNSKPKILLFLRLLPSALQASKINCIVSELLKISGGTLSGYCHTSTAPKTVRSHWCLNTTYLCEVRRDGPPSNHREPGINAQ